ncbi:MAG: 1-acyl-sn-glycerol-3-phosphate acyltransferase [Bacteroidia bacterium]|nr:1-acyl-sn-glycerol-3-phosphate acyltransferase [Bacteroidia bacterium]
MENKFIDIEALFKSKNPKLLKFLPGFLLRYLKKVIHQDEVNDFMHRNRDLMGRDFCDQVIKEFNINLKVEGAENIPLSGGIILASNHPLGGLDGVALGSVISKSRTDVNFIVNDLLLNLTNLRGLFVGVNKHGGNAVKSLQAVEALFASDGAVCLFPAGLVSRKKNNLIMDLEWKKTVISKAKKYNHPVVPVYIDGKLSPFFYRLSRFRRFIGIKANIEMLYLADQMYRQKNTTMPIIFGNPISPATFDNSKTDTEWAQWLKEQVYNLRSGLK